MKLIQLNATLIRAKTHITLMTEKIKIKIKASK